MTIIYKLLIFASIIMTIMAAISTFIYNDTSWIYTESGCFELAQDIVLIFAFITFLQACFMRGNKQEKYITIFFTILTYAFILREIDFERLNLPDWSVILFHGKGRNITIVIAFATTIILALREYKHYINQSFSFVLSKRGFLMIIAGTLLLIGGVLEKWQNFASHEFYEEMFELSGYLVYSASALLTYKRCK